MSEKGNTKAMPARGGVRRQGASGGKNHGSKPERTACARRRLLRPASGAQAAGCRHALPQACAMQPRRGGECGRLERDDAWGLRPRAGKRCGMERRATAAFLSNSVVKQKAKVCSHAACRQGGLPLQRAVNLRRNLPVRLGGLGRSRGKSDPPAESTAWPVFVTLHGNATSEYEAPPTV